MEDAEVVRIRAAVKGAAATYVAMGVEFAAGFALSILIVRGLSQEDYGGYKLIATILSLSPVFYSLGLEPVLMRFGAELLARDEPRRLRSFVLRLVGLRLAVLVLLALVALVLWSWFADFFNLPRPLVAHPFPILGLVALSAVNLLWGSVLHAIRLAQFQAKVTEIIQSIVRLIAFALVLSMGWGLTGILYAWTASLAFSSLQYTLRNVPWLASLDSTPSTDAAHGEARPAPELRRRVLRFATLSMLSGSIYLLKDIAVDNLVIAKMLGAEQVALYGLATTFVLMVMQINPAALLRSVINPWIVHECARGHDPEMLRAFFGKLTKWILVVCLPLYLGLILMGDRLIAALFRPDYVAAYPVLVVLCCTMIFLDLGRAFQPLIHVLEKKELELLMIVLSAYNLMMDILLVPRLGIIGAAVATGSACLLQLLFLFGAFRFWLRMPLRFPFGALLRLTLILLPLVGAGLLARPYISSLVGLALFGICATAYYVAALAMGGPFDTEERRFCRTLVTQWLSRKGNG